MYNKKKFALLFENYGQIKRSVPKYAGEIETVHILRYSALKISKF